MGRRPSDPNRPMYVISIAAELAGVHPQTLRVYERKGLLSPQRTEGNSRRYSDRDIAILQRIHELTNEGINLTGVMRIMELEHDLEIAHRKHERALQQLDIVQDQVRQAIDARDANALVLLKDVRRVRRAMKADMVDEMGKRRTFVVPAAPPEEDENQR
ncbi:MAG: heat shock protein transcriptional repressor HspR [Actinomycetota bacterium]